MLTYGEVSADNVCLHKLATRSAIEASQRPPPLKVVVCVCSQLRYTSATVTAITSHAARAAQSFGQNGVVKFVLYETHSSVNEVASPIRLNRYSVHGDDGLNCHRCSDSDRRSIKFSQFTDCHWPRYSLFAICSDLSLGLAFECGACR